jgi:hypothetical protein
MAKAKTDAERLADVIGMIGPDHEGVRHDGQTINAVRAADIMLRKAGLDWVDVGQALVQRFALHAAAQQLAAERDALLAEVEQLRARPAGGTLAQALWSDASIPPTVSNRHAQWALDLANQGAVHLSERETSFLDSCARRRVLTPRMQEWLRDLVGMMARRTGQAPP